MARLIAGDDLSPASLAAELPLARPRQPHVCPSEHVLRARVLADQDKHEEAINCFEEAISMLSISSRESLCRSPDTQEPSTPPPSSPAETEDIVKAMVGKGISLGKLGRPVAAAQAFDAALELNRDNVEALTYLALLHVREKRMVEGLALYRRALELDPGFTLACEGLATALTDEGTRLKLLGQTDRAMSKYREASRVCADYAPAHYNEGILLAERGLVQQALDSYARALELWPHYAEAHNNRGVLLKGMDRLPEAIEAYRACLEVNPNFQLASHNLALALSDLGTAVKAQGRVQEAIHLYQQALFYDATSADAMYNLGVAYVENNEAVKACICYQLTTEVNPRSAEAWNNLGVIYKDMDNLPRALSCYESALRIKPTFPEALNNVGVVYTIMNQLEDALPYFNSALQVAPNYAEAYTNLGKLFQDAGDADKAIEYYERCLSLCPYSDNAAHNRLLALNYSLRQSRDPITAAHTAWGQDIRARALRAAASCESYLTSRFGNCRSMTRQLRVGYLSPDFNKHSVSYFSEAILRHRSSPHFHITCYSAANKEDATTRRMRSYADAWVTLVGMPPLAVAQKIRADQIDILVELAGHTAGNRLDVMALRPAPVQITWIGYPNTTGLDTIQYRFSDQYADPLDTTQHFSEQLVRLPETFLCYTPPDESQVGPVAAPPSASLQYVTFGSFNNVAKINGRVVRLWARILLALPDSRLLLKSRAFAAKQVKDSCLCAFADFGVDRSRIDLLQILPSTRDHMAKYARMDISLDTFPYAGTTTTVEALLMGVPVVTLRATGPEATHAQNVGVSLLTQVGCTELIANSEDEFVEIAVNLARSPERLRLLRETLRQRLLASPLCDGARYMAHVENQYRAMWRHFCEDEPHQGDEGANENVGGKLRGGGGGGGDEIRAESERGGSRESGDMEEGGEEDGDMDGEGGAGEMEREVVEGEGRMDREGGVGEVYTMYREGGEGESGSGEGDAAVVGRDQSVRQHGGDKEKESCGRGGSGTEANTSLKGRRKGACDGERKDRAHGQCNISQAGDKCREGEHEARSGMGKNAVSDAELAGQGVIGEMDSRAEGERQGEEKCTEEHMGGGEVGMDASVCARSSADDTRAVAHRQNSKEQQESSLIGRTPRNYKEF